MGFDLHGIQPQENTKKPEILIKHSIGWQIEDESIQKEWYNAYEKWKNENPGVYFRSNVWYWRPLWMYVCTSCHGMLTEKDISKGQFNDGHTISKTKSKRIAARLRKLLKNLDVRIYAAHFEEERQKAEDHNKKIEILIDALKERVKEQHGDIVPKDYPEPHKTDWDNLQAEKKWEGNYPFDEEHVKEFAEFCEQSGGFQIF
jgi:uncharacterized protein YlaI